MASKINIFLGSQSPRRAEILSQAFNNIEIIKFTVSEPEWGATQSVRRYMNACIDCKWAAAVPALLEVRTKRQGILVVADTMVAIKGRLLGKPSSLKDAEKMLRSLSGSTHNVFTAVRWASNREIESPTNIVSKSTISFRRLRTSEIEDYVKTKDPLDKAGSYGLQGPALQFVDSIKGSYQNVMGFPLFDFQKSLESKVAC